MSAPLPLSAESFGLDPSNGLPALVQTHIGWVYLIGDHAIKLKKHVKFDFLDFTTLEGRRWACEREIELNSRLCPQIYIGLRAVEEQSDNKRRVVEHAASLEKIVDWAIWMRRLPAERMLNQLLEDGKVERSDVEAIANVLAGFYSTQRGRLPAKGLGDLDAVTFNIEENLREGQTLDPKLLDPAALSLIEQRARSFLKEHGGLIVERARQGFIVDGHGDLRSENICLPLNTPPVLFDCIEFNDRFRIGDSALDVAFLAMDLASRDRNDLCQAFLNRYREACDKQLPQRLLNFYLGYRAFIKGKVHAWIAKDINVDAVQKQQAAAEARKLFDLCVRYALQGRPILVVLCGISGSGKSTLARHLASRLGWQHIATDWVRDELVPRGSPAEQRYSPENSARVYELLFERAHTTHQSGNSVVLDATFSLADVRAQALSIARDRGARSILIWATCDPACTERHIQERQKSGETFGSEADALIMASQRATFQQPTESEGFDGFVSIDTGHSMDASEAQSWSELLNAISRFSPSWNGGDREGVTA